MVCGRALFSSPFSLPATFLFIRFCYSEAGLRRGYLGEMQVGGNRMFLLKFVALEGSVKSSALNILAQEIINREIYDR